MIYPLPALRALALHSQRLSTRPGAEPVPAPDALLDVIEQMGCVQIDTLQMVQRSHYMILWSRLGSYDPADLDRLAYDPAERRLFEYWYHAACLIPLSEYRYRLPMMRCHREVRSQRMREWLSKPGHADLKDAALARIRSEGGLRAADFEHNRPGRGVWWDWKPAKRALEYLFYEGQVMIADRLNFQRVYELRERVLPDWVDTTEPTVEEAHRHVLEQSLSALGVCTASQVSAYTHDLNVTAARPYIRELLAEGLFVQIQGQLSDGKAADLLVHRDNLPLLERAAAGDLPAQRTTFLSPFDALFYPPRRDRQFWNFEQTLEAYKPAAQRRWGYFCLPILHKGRLVGRFDPKLERKTGTLRLKALYLEPGIEPDEELVAGVAAAMRDFLAFHDATELVIEASQPAIFGEKLLAALDKNSIC